MKSIKFSALMLCALFLSQVSFASGTATMDGQCKVVLPALNADGIYVIESDALDFASSEQMHEFFITLSENILTYSVDDATDQVTLQIHPEYLSTTWTLADWNSHFATMAERYEMLYDGMTGNTSEEAVEPGK